MHRVLHRLSPRFIYMHANTYRYTNIHGILDYADKTAHTNVSKQPCR